MLRYASLCMFGDCLFRYCQTAAIAVPNSGIVNLILGTCKIIKQDIQQPWLQRASLSVYTIAFTNTKLYAVHCTCNSVLPLPFSSTGLCHLRATVYVDLGKIIRIGTCWPGSATSIQSIAVSSAAADQPCRHDTS